MYTLNQLIKILQWNANHGDGNKFVVFRDGYAVNTIQVSEDNYVVLGSDYKEDSNNLNRRYDDNLRSDTATTTDDRED